MDRETDERTNQPINQQTNKLMNDQMNAWTDRGLSQNSNLDLDSLISELQLVMAILSSTEFIFEYGVVSTPIGNQSITNKRKK